MLKIMLITLGLGLMSFSPAPASPGANAGTNRSYWCTDRGELMVTLDDGQTASLGFGPFNDDSVTISCDGDRVRAVFDLNQ